VAPVVDGARRAWEVNVAANPRSLRVAAQRGCVATLVTHSTHPIPTRLDVTITSDPSAIAPVRKAVEALAASAGMDDRGVGEVGLCVNEALANVIRHAYGGANNRPIVVAAYCKDDALVVTMRDWGSGVNPASLPPRRREALEPGGLGLICLRRMMTRVEYVPQADGMLLVMSKDLRESGGGGGACCGGGNGDGVTKTECGHE
jgi:serine/threonine-protein kinase RsbW